RRADGHRRGTRQRARLRDRRRVSRGRRPAPHADLLHPAQHRDVLHPDGVRGRRPRGNRQLRRRAAGELRRRRRGGARRAVHAGLHRARAAVPDLHPDAAVQARGHPRTAGGVTPQRGIVAFVVAAAAATALPSLLTPYFIHVLIQILMFAYLSYCWNILGGFAGQLSFGHAMFMAVGAYTSTMLLLTLGLSPWVGMLVGGAFAALIGLFIGYLSFRYGIKGPYFGLTTLAFAEISRHVALNIAAIGGALGLYITIRST